MSDGAVVTRNGGRFPNRGVSSVPVDRPAEVDPHERRHLVGHRDLHALAEPVPLPLVQRREYRLGSIIPVPVSPTSGPGFIGSPSGSPVIDDPPAKPCAIGSKQGKSRYGESSANPLSCA